MELKSWHQALLAFAELHPDMTDDELGELLGVQRPIISRCRGSGARHELPTHAKVLLVEYLGITWSRALTMQVLTPTAREKVAMRLKAFERQMPKSQDGKPVAVPESARARATEFVFSLLPLLRPSSSDAEVIWAQIRLRELLGLLAACDLSGTAKAALTTVPSKGDNHDADRVTPRAAARPKASAPAS